MTYFAAVAADDMDNVAGLSNTVDIFISIFDKIAPSQIVDLNGTVTQKNYTLTLGKNRIYTN